MAQLTSFEDRLTAHEADLTKFFSQERFKHTVRNYTPKDVAPLRHSISVTYPSSQVAAKFYDRLRTNFNTSSFIHTFGALDPIQVVNIAKYLQCVYVSGWQCSSTASTTNYPGPDFADYPVDTVPNKVDQLFKAQLFHDVRQQEERSRMTPAERENTPYVDNMAPILADADAGFGGTTQVMKLTRLFIEAGASGIHLEDQSHGTKKCGHMAGKVVVATRIHCNRLIASRLQADICGSPLVICARTDALGAKYIDQNIDSVDHPFILGVVDPKRPDDLFTFPEAGMAVLRSTFEGKELQRKLASWERLVYKCSLSQAHKLAESLGFTFNFDWESCRSFEGYYRIKGSVRFCVARCAEFSKYADLLWMETPKPNLTVARQFQVGIQAIHPHQMLAYNLSPSFNWDAAGMSDSQLKSFASDLGKLGYCFQFITLAGFHMNSLISEKFARRYQKDHMLAYVQDIQREERKEGVDQLKHQKQVEKPAPNIQMEWFRDQRHIDEAGQSWMHHLRQWGGLH